MSGNGIKIGVAVCVVAVAALVGGQQYANSVAKTQADKMIEEASSTMDIKYASVKGNLLGGGMKMQDITATPIGEDITIQIKELELSGYDINQTFQTSMCMNVQGISVPLKKFYDETSELKSLGYGEHLVGEFTSCYDFNLKKKTFKIEEYSIDIKDVGAASFSAKIGDIELGFSDAELKEKSNDELFASIAESAEENPMLLLGALASVSLSRAELKLTNDGLLQRVKKGIAKENESTVEATTLKMIGYINDFVEGESKAVSKLRKLLIDIAKGNSDTIRVTVKPKKAVTSDVMNNVNDLDDLVKVFGVKISD